MPREPPWSVSSNRGRAHRDSWRARPRPGQGPTRARTPTRRRTGASAMNASPTTDSPDLIEPVIGFRHWRMGQTGLLSITCDEQWQQATMTARCLAGEDQSHHPQQAAPASACLWTTPGTRPVRALHRRPRGTTSPQRSSYGGHRATCERHACATLSNRRTRLAPSRWRKRDRLVEIAERLGLPVVRHHDLKPIAGRYGAPIPVELRPGLSPARVGTMDRGRVDRHPAATTIIASRQVSRLIRSGGEYARVAAGLVEDHLFGIVALFRARTRVNCCGPARRHRQRQHSAQPASTP